MLHKLISFFTRRHLLTNMIVVFVFIGALLAWQGTQKEEMPNFTAPFIMITVSYPGAAPADVERLVTRKIEQELKGIDGVYEIRSTSSEGSCSISIEFQSGFNDMDNALNEIRSIVNGVSLPAEIRDIPKIRQFKITQKQVVSMGIYLENKEILDTKSRRKLQKIVYALDNQISTLPLVGSVTKSGYLKEEIQITLLPARLKQYNISISEVLTALQNNNIRQPAGSMNNHLDTKISLVAELDTIKKLKPMVIRSGFDSPAITLSQIATIRKGFERNTSIRKVNGREAVFFQVKKTSSSDIISSTQSIIKAIRKFEKNSLKGTDVRVTLLEDASKDVRNRLSLIGWNGLIGFVLVLIILFIFLDPASGLWVAMGIPFTFAVTLILIPLIGYSINNITLSAIIIVMGMIVDDAIVVAENVSRKKSMGIEIKEAAVSGTREVFLPIVASIVTTCAAFIPLFFFGGRFGVMTRFIPAVIFMMLFASLFESTFILPGHLSLKFLHRKNNKRKDSKHKHWFFKVEEVYGHFLEKILRFRWFILLGFVLLLGVSGYIGITKMKFVMFPREETTEIMIMGMTGRNSGRKDTAKAVQQVENFIRKEIGKNVVGFQTSIAMSRWGGAVNQNEFTINVEIYPKNKRKESTKSIVKRWTAAFRKMKKFMRLDIARSRFGQSSGSAIEVEIRGNDLSTRSKAANKVAAALRKIKGLRNVKVREPFVQAEYRIGLKRKMLKRLGISASDISTTIRTLLQGTVIYELNNTDEEVDVRVSVPDVYKKNIYTILNVPVQNSENYLVPLINVVTIKKIMSPTSIERKDFKQTLRVYADSKQNSTTTPLMIAGLLEKNVFPGLLKKYPGIIFKFGGEIRNTRESGGDITMAVILVVLLIMGILMLLFNGLSRPLVIIAAIPFGVVGIVLTFLAHGIYLIGFFTAIGALGLMGVIVNDSIVLVDKLDNEYDKMKDGSTITKVAKIAQTRLRAVLLTTLTTVAAVMPTAYGIAGYDSMLAEMMLALSWGLLFGTIITLIFVPCIYSVMKDFHAWWDRKKTTVN